MTPQFKTILLVDDSINDVEIAVKILTSDSQFCQIIVARDGAEALDYLYCRGSYEGRSHYPPLVVWLDIKMPRVDGFEVLRQMKADLELKMIPVVMLTSSNQLEDVRKAYELGANAYVVKAVDFQTLNRTLRLMQTFWTTLNEPPPTDRTFPADAGPTPPPPPEIVTGPAPERQRTGHLRAGQCRSASVGIPAPL